MKFVSALPTAKTLWILTSLLSVVSIGVWFNALSGNAPGFGSDKQLSFYGFNIGELKSSSISNMDERQLSYTDYNTSMQMALRGQLPIFGNSCLEKANSNGISMIACQPSKSDAKSIGLIYVDETLVTIVVELDPNSGDSAYKQVQSKYGPTETQWSKDKIVWWENKFKDPTTAALAPLISPFGMTDSTSCGDCKMAEFQQAKEGDHVYLRWDDGKPTYLTLLNESIEKTAWEANAKELNREVAAEKKDTAF